MVTCKTPNCGKEATLSCPTCIKLGLAPARFCSQECFKGNWGEVCPRFPPYFSFFFMAYDLLYPAIHFFSVLTHNHQHKSVHKAAKENIIAMLNATGSGEGGKFDGYEFSGSLRPAEVTPQKTVPSHIVKPDYADHPTGNPKHVHPVVLLSLQSLRSNFSFVASLILLSFLAYSWG
jgi:methionyl aminopeptidase